MENIVQTIKKNTQNELQIIADLAYCEDSFDFSFCVYSDIFNEIKAWQDTIGEFVTKLNNNQLDDLQKYDFYLKVYEHGGYYALSPASDDIKAYSDYHLKEFGTGSYSNCDSRNSIPIYRLTDETLQEIKKTNPNFSKMSLSEQRNFIKNTYFEPFVKDLENWWNEETYSVNFKVLGPDEKIIEKFSEEINDEYNCSFLGLSEAEKYANDSLNEICDYLENKCQVKKIQILVDKFEIEEKNNLQLKI